jgi:deoxyribose-phosphate aldolase
VGFFYFYAMDIRQYLDSTYLKTAEQANLSVEENSAVAKKFIQEAIDEHFKLIMIRPDIVSIAKEMVVDAGSQLAIGTVIDFPDGTSPIESKLAEAQTAVNDGADELDFVCNYRAFKSGDTDLVRDEILQGTTFGLSHNKIVKWIIETAALDNLQIAQLSSLIKNIVLSNFKEEQYSSVFVKSSTGFYQTDNNDPNGATIPAIVMMLENASPLSVKASGGVRTFEDAVEMINLGVKRIGTSAAKAIADKQESTGGY